jgi:hypothetical protein
MLLIPLGVAISTFGCGKEPADPDPPKPAIAGYGDLTWGQAPPANFQVLRDHQSGRDYQPAGQPRPLGGVEVQAVIYTFTCDGLSRVHIVTDSKDPRRVASALAQRWGPPDKQSYATIRWDRGAVEACVYQAALLQVEVDIVHRGLLKKQAREP